MSYEVNIEYKDDLIKVYTSGAANSKDSFNLLSSIVTSCKKHNCYRVLTKSGLTSMSTITAFDHIKMYEDLEITNRKYKIAWYVADPKCVREWKTLQPCCAIGIL